MTIEQLLKYSEKRLENLHPVLKEKAIELIRLSFDAGIGIMIVQGYRSFDYQNELYQKGRRNIKGEKIVTNAKGGDSYHNYGLAFDFCVLDNDGKLRWIVDEKWEHVAKLGKELGLEWGGDWKKFVDYPHFQLTFGLSIKDLKSGKVIPFPKSEVDNMTEKEIPQWKQDIMNEAVEKNLIEAGKHNPDEVADKWFVLAIANKLKDLI